MAVLSDHQIDALLRANPPLATNVPLDDFRGAHSRVQAASLDLTIGQIFVPGADDDKPGGANRPRRDFMLLTGYTAVIQTHESINLPADLVAIGFPPASLSVRGLLITNPGQIDPGYTGPLHLTVVNMSKTPFPLKMSDRIMRVIFMRLDAPPTAPYRIRHPDIGTSLITTELLAGLSEDTLDVETRATKKAEDAVRRAGLWSAGIAGVIVAGIGVVVPLLASNSTAPLYRSISDADARIKVLEGKLDMMALAARLKKLEDTAPASTGGGK